MKGNTKMWLLNKYCAAVKLIMGLEDVVFNIIEDHSCGVACTNLEPGKRVNIYINPKHEMFNTKNEQINTKNLLGVLVHEMLHKLYTDPSYEKTAMGRNSIVFPNLFHTVNNILEDFIIESRCILTLELQNEEIDLIKSVKDVDLEAMNPVLCLDSAILTSWKTSPPIKETDEDVVQIIDAMIMFTDMGPLVPESKLKESLKEDLGKIYEQLVAAVFESPDKRIERSIEIYNIVKKYCKDSNGTGKDVAAPGGTCTGKNNDAQGTLSQDEINKLSSNPRLNGQKEILKKVLKKLKKAQASQGDQSDSNEKSGGNDSEEKDSGEQSENNQDSSSSSMSAGSSTGTEDNDSQANSNAQSGSESSDNDQDSTNSSNGAGTSSETEKSSDSQANGNAKTGDQAESEANDKAQDSSSENSAAGTGNSESDSDDESKEDSESSKNNSSSDAEKKSSDADADQNGSDSDSSSGRSAGASDNEPEDASENDMDEYTEDDTDPFMGDPDKTASSIKDMEENISKETINVSEIEEEAAGDFSVSQTPDSESVEVVRDNMNAYSGSVECRNYKVTGVSDSTQKAYDKVIDENRPFVSNFARKLSKLAREEEIKEEAKSGNLNLGRYALKGQTTLRVFDKRRTLDRTESRIVICLDCSGSMSGNKIQKAKAALACVVEGLTKAGIPVKVMTFCEMGNHVEHHHYVNYRTNKGARSSIMMIRANGCNFDGYSIRYALRELQKERTRYTLMIVISDGQPSSSLVYNGTEDARQAVAEAKRFTKVIGIGVDANMNVLRSFYQDTFVELNSIETLMPELARLILKEVRKWA